MEFTKKHTTIVKLSFCYKEGNIKQDVDVKFNSDTGYVYVRYPMTNTPAFSIPSDALDGFISILQAM